MRYWLLVTATIVVSTTLVYAGRPDPQVTLNATEITYTTSENQLSATGNVVIEYRNTSTRADQFEFNSKSRVGVVSGNVALIGTNHRFSADQITYDGSTYTGTVRSLKGKLGKLIIDGKTTQITPEKITINTASITGCDSVTPDYTIRSSLLEVYPQWGVFISFDNWVSIGSVPVLWMPTFIYGSRDYSLLAANSSIPEIGANPVEGGYIRQKLGYFFNKNSNGALILEYCQNLGPVIGVTHIQRWDNQSRINIKTASNGSDGLEYQLIASLDLDTPTIPTASSDDFVIGMIDQLGQRFHLPAGQFKMGSTLRELINDSRVSKPYLVGFQINPLPIIPNFEISGMIDHALTQERTITGNEVTDYETAISGEFTKRWALRDTTTLELKSLYYGNFYANAGPWQRWFGRIAVLEALALATIECSLTQKLWATTNLSPFEFERKYAIQGTEIGTKILSTIGTSTYGIEVNYDMDNTRYRTLDFIFTPLFHCWRMPLRWKTIEGQFTFSIELL